MSTKEEKEELKAVQEARLAHVVDVNNATVFALNITNLIRGASMKVAKGESIEPDLVAIEHYASEAHYYFRAFLNKVHNELTQMQVPDIETADNGGNILH